MPRRTRFTIVIFSLFTFLTTSLALAQNTSPQTTQEVLPVAPPAVTAAPLPTSGAAPALAPAAANEVIYVVRPGETLFRIAVRFRTTVRALAEANGIANPALIYAGQRLRIPGLTPPPTPIVPPTATPDPTPTTLYIVARGDTLFRIAVRFNTTVGRLVALNSLRNPNLIYIGQTLRIPAPPGPGEVIPTVPPALATVPPTAPSQTDQGGGLTVPTVPVVAVLPTGYGFGYGVQAYLVDQDVPTLAGEITSLGVEWVKQEVLWRDFEPVRGSIDFGTLDTIVDTLRAQNLNILLTISAAPAWARASTDENGPPDNMADFATFMGALAARYAGKVQAYEIWNEPNLRREWNSTLHNISGPSYIALLRAGHDAIKAADPAAVIISAGLAPTGFNDGVNAINDRQFLTALYANGLAGVSDAIGAHPNGWANPPDTLCCDAPVGVTTHYQDASFYFQETLRAYRDIMVANGDGTTAVWVTKFGWGSSEDTDPPSENTIYVSYTSLGEQAIYNPRGFELGAELGFVGPMFLYNLNGCQAQLSSIEACYYSLIGLDGAPRPAFAAVRDLIGTDSAPEAPAPTPETALPEVPTATAETLQQPAPPTQEQLPPDPLATPEPGASG